MTITETDPNGYLSASDVDGANDNVISLTVSNESFFNQDFVDHLPPTTAATVGADQQQCNNGSFTVEANTPVVGTGMWSVTSGTATITNPASTNTTVTGVPAGTTATLRWTITNVTSTFDELDLTNDAPATVSNAGTNITQPSSGDFTMAANSPGGGETGLWTFVSGTAGTITNNTSPTTTITGIPSGDSAVYRWTITNGTCTSSSDVTITFDPLPVATNDAATYTPGSPSAPIDIVGNDTTGDTVDATTVTLLLTGLPVGSTCTSTVGGDCLEVTVPGEGVWTVNPTTGATTFTPTGGFMGSPTTITYEVEDAEGNSDTATISLTADPLPVATNDNIGTYTPGSPSAAFNVTTNDTTGDTVDPATVVFTTTGTGGTLSNGGQTLTVVGEGVWTVNASGQVVFTPEVGFNGSPTAPSYTVEDAQGNTSNEATISLTADPLPVATNDVATYTPGSPSAPIDIVGNDTTGDTVDATTVTLLLTGLPVGSTCTSTVGGDCLEVTVPGEGVWTVNPTTGATTFTPTGGFMGSPTTITYEVEDAEGNSDTATISLTANPQADLSIVKTVNNSTPDVGSNITFTLTAANSWS